MLIHLRLFGTHVHEYYYSIHVHVYQINVQVLDTFLPGK